VYRPIHCPRRSEYLSCNETTSPTDASPADRQPTLRQRVDDFLATNGIDPVDGQITALLHARVLGYVFNPISVFWCHDAAGALAHVIVEVHHTYGGRHAYLLPPTENGPTAVTKSFYVSPFNEVEGYPGRAPDGRAADPVARYRALAARPARHTPHQHLGCPRGHAQMTLETTGVSGPGTWVYQWTVVPTGSRR
jgi:hypothetical protein